MRLELGHAESVSEQAAALLCAIETRVMSLSSLDAQEGARAAGALGEDMATLRMYCVSLRGRQELVETLVDAESFLAALSSGSVLIDERVGGVLMHLVATFRLALSGGPGVGGRLSKILGDLRRVMNGLKSSRDARAQKTLVPASETKTPVDQYRDLYFAEPALARLYTLFSHLDADAASFDAGTASELFRALHTIKGNSAMIGYAEITGYAHAIEDVLALVVEKEIARDAEVARFLVECGQRLKGLLERRRTQTGPAIPVGDVTGWVAEIAAYVERRARAAAIRNPNPVPEPILVTGAASRLTESASVAEAAPAAASQDFYLKVVLAGRELTIPCSSISSVLRNQRVLALPGGREGWAGLIRCGGGLVPLVEPSTILEGARRESAAGDPAWVVVLKLAQGLVAVPVDDVRSVFEVPYDTGNAPLIDFAKIKIWD